MSHRKWDIFCVLHNKKDTQVFRRKLVPNIPAEILAPWVARANLTEGHSKTLYACKETYEQLKAACDADNPLVVLPSSVPGCENGVFSLKKFKIDDYLTDYGGTLIQGSLRTQIKLNESHLKSLPNKNMWDGTQGSTSDASRLAQFMNSSTDPNVKEIKPVSRGRPEHEKLNPVPRFAAAKAINIGEELFWDYPLVDSKPSNQTNQLKIANLERQLKSRTGGKRRSPRLLEENPKKKPKLG